MTPVRDGVEVWVHARLLVVDRRIRDDACIQDAIDLHMLRVEVYVFPVGRRLYQDVVLAPEESLVLTGDD